MNSMKFDNESVAAVERELCQGGWAGLAWACLCRSQSYRRQYRRFEDGKITARQLCRRFAIRHPKPILEAFWQGREPEFRPVRLVVVRDEDRASGKENAPDRKRVTVRTGQVAVVFNHQRNLTHQLQLAKKMLKSLSSERMRRSIGKLRSLNDMIALAAPALLTYTFATDMGWGPTQIGRHLFPNLPVLAAKTKARDLVNRGRLYAEHGYFEFAMQGLMGDRKRHRGKKVVSARPPLESPMIKLEPVEEENLTIRPMRAPKWRVR